MSTIDELINENRMLQKKNDTLEEQLTKLFFKRRSTDLQLNAAQKQELDDQIKILDKRISENNLFILEKEKQITAQMAEKGKRDTAQIVEKEKQITAQIVEKEKRDTLELQNNLELSRSQGKSAASIDSL
jgi:hypothetical protein